MAVLELARGPGGLPHVDSHRLMIGPGQLVNGRVHGIGDILVIVAGIELDAHTRGAAEGLLHQPGGLVGTQLLQQHMAVQADAVAHGGGIAVVVRLQAAVAHNHARDDIQPAPAGE